MEDHNTSPPSCPERGPASPAEMLEPSVLLLSGQHVISKASPEVPLYETSRDVTSIPQENSSIIFERVERTNSSEADRDNTENEQKRHIFYLAHPLGAQFQTDTPVYYITSVPREEAIGNISLRCNKSRLKRLEFEVKLSAARTAADKPLFDENARVLFSIRPKGLAGRWTWLDSDGSQVAVEERKGSQPTLDITVSMEREMRDALVATWCLKVWYDTAESPHAKKDG